MTITNSIQLHDRDYQLPDLNSSQLRVLRAVCLADMAGMQNQLDRARRREKEEKHPINHDWFNRCSWALKIRGETLHSIQAHIDQLPPDDQPGPSLAAHFLDEAREVLDNDLFRQIYARARVACEDEVGLAGDVALEGADG